MASCVNNIFQNIYSTCENKIVSGIEQRVWIFNRKDIEYTLGTGSGSGKNELTGITLKSGATGYTANGLKKNMTIGFERTISENAPDSWVNSISLVGYEFDKDAMRNLDEAGDLVIIAERKGVKSADGTFLCLGLENGLYCSSDSYDANSNGGSRQITFSSLDEAGEAYSAYVVTLSATPTQEGGSTMISTYAQIKDYLNTLVEE